MKKIIALCICMILILTLFACGQHNATENDLWASATHTQDAEFGTGAKEITVAVEAENKRVEFTIHTDAANLGDALMEDRKSVV